MRTGPLEKPEKVPMPSEEWQREMDDLLKSLDRPLLWKSEKQRRFAREWAASHTQDDTVTEKPKRQITWLDRLRDVLLWLFDWFAPMDDKRKNEDE